MMDDREPVITDDEPETSTPKKPRRRKAANGQPAAPKESKAERFRRLANRRVPKALKMLSVIANLSNRAAYEYTDEQRDTICSALIKAVQHIEDAFSRTGPKTDEFQL